MKINKVIISLIITVTITVSCSFLTMSSVSAESVNVDEQLSFLLSIGTPESYLEKMDHIEIMKLYDDLSRGDYIFYSADTSRYKNSLKGLKKTDDAERDSALTLSVLLFHDSDPETGQISDIYVFVQYMWEGMRLPKFGDDRITVKWDPSDFTFSADSFECRDYRYSARRDEWKLHDSFSNPASLYQGSLGYYAEIQGYFAGIGASRQKGICGFNLLPAHPTNLSEADFSSIRVEYKR